MCVGEENEINSVEINMGLRGDPFENSASLSRRIPSWECELHYKCCQLG